MTSNTSTAESGSNFLELQIADTFAGADGVKGIVLRSAGDEDLPEWAPGAHLDLYLPSGLIRQYSLCSDPKDRSAYRLAVLLEKQGRGGSEEVHASLEPGMRIRVSRPRNNFELHEAQGYLFVAGGIGVTPILPMIREADAKGVPYTVVYGGRSRSTMAFLDEIQEIVTSSAARIDIVAEDTDGFPDLARYIAELPEGHEIYACGPAGLLNAMTGLTEEAGIAPRLHLERFAADPALETDPSLNKAFDVELRRTGLTIHVPADRTLLEEVEDVLPDVDFSCREGYCGTCEVRVLCGEPEHRDSIDTPQANDAAGRMFICVGRSKSDKLVLDI